MKGLKEIALYCDGKLVEKGTVREICDKYGWDPDLIYKHIRSSYLLLKGAIAYKAEYTGVIINSRNAERRGRPTGKYVTDAAHEPLEVTKERAKKARAKRSELEAAGREHGRSYGYEVAFRERGWK